MPSPATPFDQGTEAPKTNFNPFDGDAGAPPPPSHPDGTAREVMDPVTRQRVTEPTRQEPPAPAQRQAEPPARTEPPAQQQQQPPAQGTQAPGSVVMTDVQLQALARSMRPEAPPQRAPQAPQMTDEEFAKAFNVHKVTPEEYEAILGIKPDKPERVAALDAALQNVSRQSVTIARHMIEDMAQKLGLQIQPAREAMLLQQAREDHAAFVGANTDLKDYTPLLQELVVSTKAKVDAGLPIQWPDGRVTRGFANKPEAAQFVAATARKLLNLPAYVPGQQQQQQQPPSRQQGGSRGMSTTSMGGRTGSSGGATPVLTQAERLFGGSENT